MHIAADLHIHTTASGHAYSTVYENVKAAKAKGLEMIAITDHGPAIPGGPDNAYFGYLQILPDIQEGVEILVGIEANILDADGTLDIPDEYLEKLDIVLVGFHPPLYYCSDIKKNTTAVINVLKNPLVDVLVHPGNPAYPLEVEEVLSAAEEYDCLLEINNSSLSGGARKGSHENCFQIAEAIARKKMPVTIGSDAHYIDRVGEFKAALDLIDEAGIDEEQVLNTSVEKVKKYLRTKGKLSEFGIS